MKLRALSLICMMASLPIAASAQTHALANAGGELPLLGFISAGVIAGGVLSIMKTRQQK
jgi:hypothetical protein